MKIKKNIFLTIMILVASIVLTACGGTTKIQSSSGQESASKVSQTSNVSNIPEKTIVRAVPYIPSSLLPILDKDEMNSMVQPVYEHLFELTDEGYEYYLAESLEISDDGKTYTLKLDPDANWSDGKPIVADDVILAIEYKAYTSGGVSNITSLKGEAVNISKIDDKTVQFEIPLPYNMYARYLMLISPFPSHAFDNDVTKVEANLDYFKTPGMATSGAYNLKEYNEDSIVFEKRKDAFYRGDAGAESIVYRVIPAGSTEQVAFENGDLSLMRVKTAELLEKYKSMPDKYNLYSFSEDRTNYIQLNPTGPAGLGDNLDARRAIMMALSQEEILQVVYGTDELAELANSVINPGLKYHDPELKGYEQNLEEAKKLAKSSGLEGKTLIYIYNNQRANMEDIAVAVQQQLSQIGVNVQVEGQDSNTYWPRFFWGMLNNEEGSKTWDLGSNGYNSERGPYGGALQGMYLVQENYYGTSKELQQLATAAMTETDENVATGLYKQLQQMVKDECIHYPLPYPTYVLVTQKNVTLTDEKQIVPGPSDWLKFQVN